MSFSSCVMVCCAMVFSCCAVHFLRFAAFSLRPGAFLPHCAPRRQGTLRPAGHFCAALPENVCVRSVPEHRSDIRPFPFGHAPDGVLPAWVLPAWMLPGGAPPAWTLPGGCRTRNLLSWPLPSDSRPPGGADFHGRAVSCFPARNDLRTVPRLFFFPAPARNDLRTVWNRRFPC